MNLTTPLGDEVLRLSAGERITLSGTVYTARDRAHARMCTQGIPFNPQGAAIYHSGPIVCADRIVAAGPTTSSRLDRYTGFLMDAGVRALIGKGGMGASSVAALQGRGVYLACPGGCAPLAASHMALEGVLWEDLGMAEAVWVIRLDRLPLIVGTDAHGGDLFSAVHAEAARRYADAYGSGIASCRNPGPAD
ncbi:MAG: fumarate hydratase C-terminal domain-containing protein [Methanomicrobiales archaeon]|nr:fumarate hydratase C-terminal domain-containing protein [Methanomicrobiales archaeon]